MWKQICFYCWTTLYHYFQYIKLFTVKYLQFYYLFAVPDRGLERVRPFPSLMQPNGDDAPHCRSTQASPTGTHHPKRPRARYALETLYLQGIPKLLVKNVSAYQKNLKVRPVLHINQSAI